MTKNDQMFQVISGLQLPVPNELENEAFTAILSELSDIEDGRADDLAIVLNDALKKWEKDGNPPQLVIRAVSAGLGVIEDEYSINGKDYFIIYGQLRRGGKRDWRGLPHAAAVRLLSRSRLINHLLKIERFSCSQITRFFHATEATLSVPYKAVQVIASKIEAKPELDLDAAGDFLWAADSKRAGELFTDSDLTESCFIASEEIRRWSPETNAEVSLRTLLDGALGKNQVFWPYLQILHWCTIPLEFYDHPASHLYEFAPRSALATDVIFSRYPAATGNPVLNNAKAVSKIDQSWASNRSGQDGHALVQILAALEALPFQSRRDIARVLRAWLARVIELSGSKVVELPTSINLDDYQRLVHFICKKETNTGGVIEQRVVDALCVLAFSGSGWLPRGLGDSVNASNLSKKKLGDIEFANVDKRRAVAIEAHGGFLSHAYVSAHQKSLVRVVEHRLDESWANLDLPENWSIEVVFVAHSIADGLPNSEVILDVPVTYQYINYSQLADMSLAHSDEHGRREAFDLHVRKALNRHTVRQSARDKVKEIMGVPPSESP